MTNQESTSLDRNKSLKTDSEGDVGNTKQKKKDTDIKQSMSSGFAALTVVSNACNAVQNAVLDIPKEEAKELADLKTKLQAAKDISTEWTGGLIKSKPVLGLAPEITANIPNSIVNYGTTFTQATNDILALATKNGGTIKKGTDDYNTSLLAIQSLSDSIDKIIKTINTESSTLNNWGDQMRINHSSMLHGVHDIQNVNKELHADITAMNSAIANLHKEIDAETEEAIAAASAMMLGTGLIIVGVLFMPESDGVSGQLVVVGAASLIGGTVEFALLLQDIKKNFKAIKENQKKITADQQLIVALQGLTLATNLVVGSIATATKYLNTFETSWNSLQGDLNDVIKKLNAAEKGSSIDFKSLLNIQSAQAEWAEVMKEANALLNLKTGTINKKVGL